MFVSCHKRLVRYGLLAGFALATASVTAAPPPWFVRTWQSDAGLPDNTVVGIEQTLDGFLWVATHTGLVRFDGLQFQPFIPVRGSGDEIALIEALLVDSRGRLWVAKERSIVICLERGQTTVFAPKDGLLNLPVSKMVEDGVGDVWISYKNGDIARIQQGQVRLFSTRDGLPEGGTCELVISHDGRLWLKRGNWVAGFRDGRFHILKDFFPGRLASARAGGFWICTGSQLYRLSEGGALVRVVDLPAALIDKGVTVLHEDKAGILWIGTREAGLFFYDSAGFERVSTPNHTILRIKEDLEGTLWVGMRGGGLSQLKPRVAELLTISESDPFKAVRSVCEDTDGQLWAVVWDKGDLLQYSGQGWTLLSPADGWTFPFSRCVAADPGGGVWIGMTENGVQHWQDGVLNDNILCIKDGLASSWITALLATDARDVWIGSGHPNSTDSFLQRRQAGILSTFPLPLGSGWVTALAMDSVGDCWAATSKGMLLRIHKDVLTDETQHTMAAACSIRCLSATPDGSLWIGYSGRGLGRLKAGHFNRCGIEHGMRDDYVSQILPDGSGRLWLAGNRGIFSIREKDFDDFAEGRTERVRPLSFGQKDGVLGLQANFDAWPGAQRCADGRLLFAMQSGIAIVHAQAFKENPMQPPVIIERVRVNGKILAAYGVGASAPEAEDSPPPVELSQEGARLRLSPGQRQVEFFFTALSFVRSENLGFKYRLHGLDQDWVEADLRRVASYALVPPGDYRFQVLACNSDGVWNETGASLELIVEPYWWETTGFQLAWPLASVGLLLAGVLLFVRGRYRRKLERLELQRAMELERARISQDLHDDLGAELASIAMLSDLAQLDVGENLIVRDRLGKIIGHARQTILSLEEIVWAVNPTNDTVERFVSYVCKFAQNYLELAGVRARFDLPDCFPSCVLASKQRHNLFLATKEALHNAVRHGKPAEVTLCITLGNGHLSVIVEDDGVGFEDTPEVSAAHGSGNMRARMGQINGTFERRSTPGQGTTISLSIPVQGEMK